MKDVNKTYRIFISSCKRLLEKERRYLSDIILGAGFLPIQMESNFNDSTTESIIEIDKKKIQEADCVIFLLSYLYGECIDEKIKNCGKCDLYKEKSKIKNCKGCCNFGENKCQISFTEYEYEYAKLIKKPTVVIYNSNYNNVNTFEKTNDTYKKETGVNCTESFYKYREQNKEFVEKATINISKPYRTEDEFNLACSAALKSAVELINELEKKENIHAGLVSNELYYQARRSEQEIKKQFYNLQKDGIENVFTSQKEVLEYLSKQESIYYGSDGKIKPIRVLAIRGLSFVKMGRDWCKFILDDTYKNGEQIPVEFILANTKNDKLVSERYQAFKQCTDFDEFKQEYVADMERVQRKIKEYKDKQDCSLYLHNEARLLFRMVFIGKYLYINSLLKNEQAIDSPVIKIPDSSTLYKVCEEYYEWIKSASNKQNID